MENIDSTNNLNVLGLANSELVTNEEGCVYHLNLLPEHLADDVIVVGDPNRVPMLSSLLDSIELRRSNREIVTHTGYIGKKRITIMSTGMGTDNIDIVMTELDVLASFDLKTKTLKDKCNRRTLNIIRLGSCGALQKDIEPGHPVMTHYAVGLDGLLYFYDCNPEIFERELTDQLAKHLNWDVKLPSLYCTKASEKLEKLFEEQGFIKGITLSAPGFYGPQGRNIHLPLKYPDINDKVETFAYNGYKIANYEMESSATYGLGKALGHNALTICIPIANRTNGKFVSDYHSMMINLGAKVFEILEATA